ncbi:MAG: rRNA maturation RNase YbeY [Planctomycetota bacterium]|jgi:probable rRNA maturation factor|nr:rRNA maturation RNase YbeY [Planctomycetota bacterium]
MAKIEITDLQDHVRLDKKMILQIVRRVIKEEGRSAKSLSIVLTDNRHIRDLNREYLGRNGVTDVISFPLEDLDWPDGHCSNGGINGEIIASAELAVQQAQTTNTDPRAELMLYLVHGLLHLMGYDDRKPEQARQMHAREDALLEDLGFGCVYAGRSVIQ